MELILKEFKKLRTDQRSMPSRCISKLLKIQNENNDLGSFYQNFMLWDAP
jgi:hypothetical protein